MKKTNRMISVILALIIALSCITMGVTAANVDAAGNFILKASTFKAGAAKFALCETVHGNVGKGEQWYYTFYLPSAQTVAVNYSATSQISFQIETATGVSVYSNNALMGSSTLQLTLGGGWYYVRVANTASSDLNPNVSYTFTVLTASPAPLYVDLYIDDVYVSPGSVLSMKSGEEAQLTVKSSDIPNLNWFWRVLDDPATYLIDESKFISISDDGRIKVNYWTAENNFEAETDVKVQALTYYYNSSTHTVGDVMTKTITVRAIPANFSLTPEFNKTDKPLVLQVGTMQQVVATSNTGIGTFKWESMDPTVATVDNYGRVTAVAPGTTYVRVTLIEADAYREFIVQATAEPVYRVAGVSFVADTITLSKVFFQQNPTKTLTVNNDYKFTTIPAAPDGIPTNSKVTFVSSDPNIVQVDANGKLTAGAEGTAVITITTDDGGYTDTVEVTVGQGNWIIVGIRMLFQGLLKVLQWITGGAVSF